MIPRNVSLAALLATVVMASSSFVCAAEKPNRPFDLGISLETRYDDNILQLSEEAQDRFREEPDPERFLIESIDDYVAIGKIDLRWRGKPIRKRETAVRAFLDAFRYVRNDIKDYEKFGISISQELTASRRHLASLQIRYSRIPDFYKRHRVDEDASFDAGERVISSYDYEEDRYSVTYEQAIVNRRLEARLDWKYFDRDYNESFNERDSTKDIWSLALIGRPFRDTPLEVGLAYGTGDLRARGDLPATPITDDDVSYRLDTYLLDVEYRWKGRRGGRVGVSAEREFREFTSDNAFDLGHFGREDERNNYRVRLDQRLSRKLVLLAKYHRKSREVTLPPGIPVSDDETDFVEHRITVGVAWELEF